MITVFLRGCVPSAYSHSIDGPSPTKEKGCQFAKYYLSSWVILPQLQQKVMHTVPEQSVQLRDKMKV